MCTEGACIGVQMQTVPYLIDNPEVGYVQTRWIFANPDESYLTKAQEISLNFHCKCEQFVHFASGSFFNFNGTAGECPSLLIEVSVSACSAQRHSLALDVKQPLVHRLMSSIGGAFFLAMHKSCALLCLLCMFQGFLQSPLLQDVQHSDPQV